MYTKFSCTVCDYRSKMKHHVDVHIKQKHENMPAKVNNCETCTFCLKGMDHLKCQAKRVYTKSGHFSCESCDFQTNIRQCLAIHDDVRHKNIKKYECPVCLCKTYSSARIKTHMKSKHRNITVINNCCIRNIHIVAALSQYQDEILQL